jgi:hypothetical protein
MEENNNKPIGFTHRDRPYGAFRDFVGTHAASLSIEKFSIWDYPIGTRSASALGGPFICFGAHMGVVLGVPIASGVFEQTIGLHNSGKPNKCSEKRKSMEKIGKCLTFSKFRLFRPLSAGPRPLYYYTTSRSKSQ